MALNQTIEQFYAFWNNKPVHAPLLSLDVTGWFPFERFSVLRSIKEDQYIESSLLDPLACIGDYRMSMELYASISDDLVRSIAPIPALPWIEGMLGCPIKRKGQSFWAEELFLPFEQLRSFDSITRSPWFTLYREFVRTLRKHFYPDFPVGLPILRGVSDLWGVLAGHSEAIVAALEHPQEVKQIALKLSRVVILVTQTHHQEAGLFQGGTVIEQYGLWAPGPIVRIQEDASALYSPELFRTCILPATRKIAQAFPYSLLHLHSSSLFLLEEFLSIKEIGVFQVNRDVGEMGLPEMEPFLKTIQKRGRRLYLRGSFTEEDYRWIQIHLSPVGLIVQGVVSSATEGKELLAFARSLWPARGRTVQ